MWNLPPPPGFQGLREDLPLEVYVRHLPHWRQEGATYFVTFRLADSLPQVKLDELAYLRSEWERKYPPPWTKETLEGLARQVFERVERWLDQGMGSCVLKDPSCVALVREALLHFDGTRYELGAFVVMPNHVHALVRPLAWKLHSLETIVGGWKQFSSRRINERIGAKGKLWQDESYDRIVRDAEHLWRCLQYIGRNPEKAGLAREACLLWVKPEWAAAGWTFEADVGRAS
jgi:REP element-mobilizing transposase RayT